MITKRKKFLALSSLIMIIGLTLAACQPFAAISDSLSEGMKTSSESESLYSYLPGELVNLGTEKFPITATIGARSDLVGTEVHMPSTVVETNSGKALADLLSKPGIHIKYQSTGKLVNVNSSIEEPEVSLMGLKERVSPLTLQLVSSPGPGWVVIHADENGLPGKILDYISVKEGTSFDVVVETQSRQYDESIHTMLHVDSGIIGQFEYPKGPDSPVYAGSRMINEPVMLMER